MKAKYAFGWGLFLGLIGGAVATFAVLITLAKRSESVPKLPTMKVESVATADALLKLVEQCPAEVGFYGRNLRTGRTVEYRPDQPACLASIVKLFTLLEVMKQVDDDKIRLTDTVALSRKDKTKDITIADALDLMIGKSDNAATDSLTALVGYDNVNGLPRKLGIAGLSQKILPKPGVLQKVLDKRVFAGARLAVSNNILPQHGTARGMVKYFELLDRGTLLSPGISRRVLEVLDRNPKGFAPGAPVYFKSVGKGGSIIWKRPGREQYNMMGWALYLGDENTSLALCLWCERFPENTNEESKWNWCYALSDSIVNALLGNRTNRLFERSALCLPPREFSLNPH